MWSDNETHLDFLDFRHLKRAVVQIVETKSLHPATIGIHGDWGSGKSSLLRMVKQDLDQIKGFFCVDFNGWQFEGYDGAKTALIETLLDEIAKNRTLGEKAEGLLEKLLRRINWMRLVWTGGKYATAYAIQGGTGVALSAGMDIATVAKRLAPQVKDMSYDDIAKFFKDELEQSHELNTAIRHFNKDFANLLSETDIETLVVFIDDLDRCMPDTIIETLEAIKLFLFSPNTVFIIGADEELVRYAVRRRFPELPGLQAEVGRDYLEKLIQFPVRIPPLGRVELETYINLLFAEVSGLPQQKFEQLRQAVVEKSERQLYEVSFNYSKAQELLENIPKGLEEGLIIAQYLAPVLTAGMAGNPRQTKRFLNTLIMRQEMAKSREVKLEARVLAKLMLLEYFRSEFFKELAQLQAENNGCPQELDVLERRVGLSSPQEEKDNDSQGESHSSSDIEESVESSKVEMFVEKWLSDQWVMDWSQGEPSLNEVDLRPYFYFSRDILGPLSGAIKRISPAAHTILVKLLSESEAMRNSGVNEAKGISEADAAAIVDALAERAKRQEHSQKREQLVLVLFSLVEVRKEQLSQLMAFLDATPENLLFPVVVPRLEAITTNTAYHTQTIQLLTRWSKSASNQRLAGAAETRLARISKK